MDEVTVRGRVGFCAGLLELKPNAARQSNTEGNRINLRCFELIKLKSAFVVSPSHELYDRVPKERSKNLYRSNKVQPETGKLCKVRCIIRFPPRARQKKQIRISATFGSLPRLPLLTEASRSI